jgi:Tol biopolymer transport system component
MFTEFLTRYKKIFLILGFIGVVVLIGYLIYSSFFKPTLSPTTIVPQPIATTTVAGSLPTSSTGTNKNIYSPEGNGAPLATPTKPVDNGLKEKELNNGYTSGATLDSSGKGLQYYNQADGKFYKLDASGNVTPLTDQIFHEVQNIVWSNNKNKAVLEYPDGAKIVYNFATKQQVTLPSHWQDFSFSPDGNSLVTKSMGVDPDNRWLAITSADGSNVRKVEELGDNGDKVIDAWSPDNQVIAMYTQGIDAERQEVFFVGQNNENFKSMVVNGRGFDPAWSPDGKQLLYSVYASDSNLKPTLWIANAQGDAIGTGRTKLNVDTWADKCIFADSNKVYCAVPQNLQDGAGMFPELAAGTTDQLYQIDLTTNAKKLVSAPAGDYTMSNLIISPDKSTIYFTDQNTKKLYSIKINEK